MPIKRPVVRIAALFVAVACALTGLSVPTFAQGQPFTSPALQRCTPTLLGSRETTQPDPVLPDPGAAAVLKVVTTVAPITNVVFNIGGPRVAIRALIPEGQDSHTFEPKPSDAAFLAEADLIFLNGLRLEEPSRKLAEANLKPGAEIIALGNLTLPESDWVFDFSFPKEGGDPNPHLWVNPLLTLEYAKIVRDTLTRRDPDGAAYYLATYTEFERRITVLDQAICNTIQTIPEKNRKLLTYHDSFAYFAPRYGMTVIGAIQPSDFSEPSAQDVARLIEQIKAEGVPAIFGSEVFPSPIIEQIGKEAGVKFIETLSDDDLPNQTGDRRLHSFLMMMVENVKTMTAALGGDPAGMNAVRADNIQGDDSAIVEPGE